MAKQQYRAVQSAAKKGSTDVSKTPWPWILLALNPLFIVNGIHTIDFYIKALWISLVLAVTFFMTRNKAADREPWSFNVMEIMWLGYMAWGVLSLFWVESFSLTFERLVYLGYPIGAYVIGKQTYFWRSSKFWDVYAGVALLVGLIGCCMWWFAGTDFGFDWIMSAGRPSSTLSYRAYAGTYMVTTLPFLLWYMFSRHIRSAGHFLFAALSFSLTFLFLVYTRARSGWMGLVACFLVMGVLAILHQIRQREGEKSAKIFEKVIYLTLAGIIALFGIGTAAIITDPVGLLRFSEITLAASVLIAIVAAIAVVVGVVWAFAVNFRHIQKYVPILAIVLLGTAYLSTRNSSEQLKQVDTNVQTLTGTDKESFSKAVSTIFKVIRSGSSDRVAFWQISRRMLFEKSVRGKYEGPNGMPHWVLGVGQNQWPIWVPLYSDILHSLGAEVHNDWIQAFVEGGPIGFFFWIGFTLSLIYYAWRIRDKDISIAVMGCVFAWIFATQSDFLTARIYGALWLGGIAAILWGENKLSGRNIPLFTLGFVRSAYWMRVATGVFFLWLGASYAVTMWADRQIYVALVTRTIPVDRLVAMIFPLDNSAEDQALAATLGGSKPMFDYSDGVGKYLIFSPINDLSRAISISSQRGDLNNQTEAINNVQKKISKEVLKYHPYQFSAMQMLADINFRQKNYPESVKFAKQYLEIRPKDANVWLFTGQVQLAMGDNLGAARSVYQAMQLNPELMAAQQFWQFYIKPESRDAVLKQQSAK